MWFSFRSKLKSFKSLVLILIEAQIIKKCGFHSDLSSNYLKAQFQFRTYLKMWFSLRLKLKSFKSEIKSFNFGFI